MGVDRGLATITLELTSNRSFHRPIENYRLALLEAVLYPEGVAAK